jgi:O-antigen/teichoic acid export membrane protein
MRFGAQSLVTSLAIQILNVCSGVMLARMLGPVGRGQLAAIVLWPALLAGLGSMGLYEAGVFFSARRGEDPSEITASSFLSALGLSVGGIALGLMIIPLALGHYGSAVVSICLLYLCWIPLNLLTYAATGILVGRQRTAAFNRGRLIYPIVTVVGLLALIATGRPTLGPVAAVYVLANLVTLAYVVGALATFKLLTACPSWRLARNMLAYGFKAHVGNVANLANDRADQAVVSVFLSPVFLGYYSVAVTVSSVIALLGSSMALAILPSVAGADDESERKDVFASTTRLTAMSSLIGCLLLIPLVPLVITIFFGSRFLPAVFAAEILALASFAFGLSRVFAAGFVGLKRPWAASFGQMTGLAVTVVGLVTLVPRLGILGAALASLLAYSTTLGYFVWAGWRIGISPARALLATKSDFKRGLGWLSRDRADRAASL